MQRRLLLLREEHVLGMQRHAVDLAGDQARQAARGRRGDELRVADVELGGLEHLAAHAPVEAADAAAGRATGACP